MGGKTYNGKVKTTMKNKQNNNNKKKREWEIVSKESGKHFWNISISVALFDRS